MKNDMRLPTIVSDVADYLKEFDATRPCHKLFKPGIGPFGEPQLVREISRGLTTKGYICRTRRTPDLEIGKNEWAIEFKIVRPYGDNGKEAENWSVNLLHPYEGNTSAIGDALKLRKLDQYTGKAIFIVGFQHEPENQQELDKKITLDPLIQAFEKIASDVIQLNLSHRFEEIRPGLVHPYHQVLRCIAWEVQ